MTTHIEQSNDETVADTVVHTDLGPHLGAMPPLVGDVPSLPSHAELARTLVEPGALAAVATITETGHPYTSTVPISTVDGGCPVVCISQLAEHTINLHRDPRASLLVHAAHDPRTDPLAVARVTLVGSFVPFEPDDAVVEAHLAVHPHSALYARFPDFGWWRFELFHARYVGGFGVMSWVSADDWAAAAADPVIPEAPSMIDHLNDDHADACVDIARRLLGAEHTVSAHVTALDRRGMTMELRDHPYTVGEPMTTAFALGRVAFDHVLGSPQEVRSATVDLVRRARHDHPPTTDIDTRRKDIT